MLSPPPSAPVPTIFEQKNKSMQIMYYLKGNFLETELA